MPFTTGEDNLLRLNQSQFDFNVQLERLFFSILPSAFFIVTSSWRTLTQIQKPILIHAPTFRLLKVGAIIIYASLELALLMLVAVGSFHVTSMFLAASALKLVSALLMVTLSVVDHSRSPRPSVLLSVYLSVTLLLDVAQVRTLYLSSEGQPELIYSGLFSATIAMKVATLLLEAKQKSAWVQWNEKEHSPEETSGIFSLGVFSWLNSLFKLGYGKILATEDLYPLDSAINAKLLHDKFSENMDYSILRSDKYGLVKVLLRTLTVPLLLPIPPRLALLGFTLCQPFFLERLVNYLSEPEKDVNVGYGLIGASVLIYTGKAISEALYWYFHNRTRMMARSILVTEIYLKATIARIGTTNDSAALTLMSTDVERIIAGFRALHEIWVITIQVVIAGWMLYNRVGVVLVAPIGLVIVCTAGLMALMHFTGDSQRTWMSSVQKRVGLTAVVIASMKNLKISGLTSAVGNFVQKLRVEELAAGSRFRVIFIVAAALGFVPQLIGPPLTFAFTQQTLDASKIFTSLAFLTLLTSPLSEIFQALPSSLAGIACLGRIQTFLQCETQHDFRQVLEEIQSEKNRPKITDHSSIARLAIEDGNFGWEAEKFVLQNINTQILNSSLTVVVGPVGSGKSTLCTTLLGEIPFSEGSVVSNTKFTHVGYCSQSAFLSNGSVRDNIVGFCPFNEERYYEVINATALSFDLNTLPHGDKTNIGSDGITLSGGQRQRVALARALYLGCEFIVLDDIFSGLDADTEEQVFQQVFGPNGLLRQRRTTVVLCTHSVKHLPAADHIIVLEEGRITEQGSFVQLMSSRGYVQRLGIEDSSNGEVSSKHTTLQESKSQLWTTKTKALSLDAATDLSRQVGDKTVYKHYIKSMGVSLAVLSLFFAALWGLFTNFPTIWLTYWTNDVNSDHPRHSYAYYAGLYALFQVAALISILSLGICLWIVAINRAGGKIHHEALHTLLHAPLRFFTDTDTGVVTNLFSQDLNLVDTELPIAILNTLYCVFQSLGQAAVMLTSSAYLGIAYPFLGIILYVIGRFYLRTSRQLRLLDLESKSPLYTHFLDTVKGITTMRAFGFLPNEIEKNARLLDASQRPAYLLMMIQEWLSLALGLVVMVIAVILVTLSVQLESKSAFAGASLYSLISLGENLAGIVLYYTRLETSIGAIARLKTFNETVKAEDRDEEDLVPDELWPRTGAVELKGVSAGYDTENPNGETPNLALHNISLSITSGEKIAICGRTGSGKSSLIALLLKLLDPLPSTSNNITIENTPLNRINRSTLRQRIIAVPQEAVFLPDGSTFLSNLDPSNTSTPEDCEAVLTAVRLAKFVQERGGLDAGMHTGTLSAGQRQLMSVGRALLRRRVRARQQTNGGILLLDEVSSSVDQETERVMQDIIRTEFEGYTVIAVSHRLDMIMDFDRVVVMDTGKVVEIGNPAVLGAAAGTRFGDLVKAGKEK